jgi:hypothetical protein
VAVGTRAGKRFQGHRAVAVGWNAGALSQGVGAVAIGSQAGSGTPGGVGIIPVNVGYVGGRGTPEVIVNSVTDLRVGMLLEGGGFNAGERITTIYTGNNTIAVGSVPAGTCSWTCGTLCAPIYDTYAYGFQGINSIAIGAEAAQRVQANSSIVINSTGSELLDAGENTVVIKTIRTVNDTPPAGFSPCYYNPTTGELIVVVPT